jgi:prevent-host-death family protein
MKAKRVKEIGAAQFKAKCLGLIAEIEDGSRKECIITKRGKPVAKLVPIKREPFLYGCMKGLGEIRGDIMEPLFAEWEGTNR